MSSMSTCSTWPGRAPRTATGPVQMWPGIIFFILDCWMAWSTGGTTSGGGGSVSGPPDTVEIVTTSPLLMAATGLSFASRKPQCTVSTPASTRIALASAKAFSGESPVAIAGH